MSFNFRYVCYAHAYGCSPEQMLAQDAVVWPGGKMAGFILWMNEQWQEWRKARGKTVNLILDNSDHADFDAWLGARVGL